MTVREVLDLLSYATEWQLVGAKTGKKLCDNYNKKETREKYMDLRVSDEPISADFRVSKDSIVKSMTNYIRPMVTIWVSGK
jgi:hypothetical protein